MLLASPFACFDGGQSLTGAQHLAVASLEIVGRV